MTLIRLALLAACVMIPQLAVAQTFQLSYSASANAGPITGRAFLFVARTDKEEPRLQSGADRESEPFFGVDVDALAPGKAVTIDPNVPGFPVVSLAKLPAGDYYVQGLLPPYTRFKRSDGHTIWAHMDAGEGQRFNRSPGSLVSEVQKVPIDATRKTAAVSLSLTMRLALFSSVSRHIAATGIPTDPAGVLRAPRSRAHERGR